MAIFSFIILVGFVILMVGSALITVKQEKQEQKEKEQEEYINRQMEDDNHIE